MSINSGDSVDTTQWTFLRNIRKVKKSTNSMRKLYKNILFYFEIVDLSKTLK